MARRITLPVSLAGDPPTVDAIRKKLGGRAESEAGVGEIVTLRGPDGTALGVVLFARGRDVDVWIGLGVVKRMRRDETLPQNATPSDELAAIAADARAFAALREGDPVGFASDHATGEGVLVEKCRFGAVIERADKSLVGAGFRRVWTTRPGDPAARGGSDRPLN